MRQVVLDTETTGLDTSTGHRIIEIAAVELIDGDFTGKHFHRYVNPQCNSDDAALQVHGLTAEFLRDKQTFGEIAQEFMTFVRGAELIIHNATFDVAFLNYQLELLNQPSIETLCTIIDTLKIARKLYPGKRNGLDALCERYQVDTSTNMHRGALLDALLLAQVYVLIAKGKRRQTKSSIPFTQLLRHRGHDDIVKQGVNVWNNWRRNNPKLTPDLRFADLRQIDLEGADLSGTILEEARLRRANLIRANLYGALLPGADLSSSNLSGADLCGTNLWRAHLDHARLDEANLSNATMHGTSFGNVDLRNVKGLESVKHYGPSSIGVDSVFRSQGDIPEIFLRGCGVPDIFITYLGSLVTQPIQYYSCFISYSTKDQDFADRLYNDLQAKGVRCWFAPHHMEPGKKIHEQIDKAIRIYDKLLVILSSHSMDSEWVRTEISKARAREKDQRRRMLFPVRLVDFSSLQAWECFDADVGKDSAREIREYYIPDFSAWKSNADIYNAEFLKLLDALKAGTNDP